MQFTIPAELWELSTKDAADINELMRTQCSAKRFASNRLLEGVSLQPIIQILQDTFPLNWRYCEHAARDAQAQIRSQRKLLPLYIKDVKDRIKEVERKLARIKSRRKRKNLERELSKLEKKRRFYEGYTKSGTIPKTIFGGRRSFEALLKGKVSREEWRELRNNQLYSIGQANQKGNANLRVVKLAEGGYGLQVRFIDRRNVKVEKDGRKLRYKSRVKVFKLYAPAKFQPYLEWLLQLGAAYSVRIIKKDQRYFVHISFKINNTQLAMIPERVAAVDANPEGPAVTVVGRDGNILAHKLLRDDRLIYASQEKRDCIIGVLVREIVDFAEKNHATTFVIENLKIRNHRNFGRRANRVIYAFTRRKFKETLLTKCWKHGYPAFTVNPAYTSVMGKKKYAKRMGLSPHEAAALVIGRRFYGYGEKLPKPVSITMKVKTNRGRSGKKNRVKLKVPVRYVWSSIYGYLSPADPYRAATDGRKGSREPKLGLDNTAVFTGHPAGLNPPLSLCSEGVRKGGECGGNPQATGDGGKPASTFGVNGRFEAKSLHDT